VFMARLAPLQRQLLTLAQDSAAFDLQRYAAVARRWEMWGALALLTPIGALVLMILKPIF